MAVKQKLVAQNPLILRCHRIMEAFAKSDDERDFYLDRQEGFLIYVDLDKTQEELDELEKELEANAERYYPIPKLTFYEVKKIMEGFVNEKVYDIDTKEKLLDIIQSKEARENFLEFIYDHHTELEKWQQYYQERFRVRIIEWLRNNEFEFVFEEDLDLTKSFVEKLKMNLFLPKVSKDLLTHRKGLIAKAKTYYSNEALNPRPKRGRPPKQVAKVETEPQFSEDIYTSLPRTIKPFLFAPDYHGSSAIFTFSGKFTSEADLLAHRRQQLAGSVNMDLQNLSEKLAALRSISSNWNVTPVEITREVRIDAFEEEASFSQPLLNNVKASMPTKKELKKDPPRLEKPKAKAAPVQNTKKVAAKPAPKFAPKAAPKPAAKAPTRFASKPVSKTVAKSTAKPASKKPIAKLVSKPVAKKTEQKSVKKPVKAVAKVAEKKKPAKMRLRPLPKKGAAAHKEKKSEKSAPGNGLRMLRRAKKR
ncbi:MAG: hypothetical protein JSR46_11380 [Verrucomicrobia bacterium]|nr:hypothetical protein [Verrucomicrobiota bacterium]